MLIVSYASSAVAADATITVSTGSPSATGGTPLVVNAPAAGDTTTLEITATGIVGSGNSATRLYNQNYYERMAVTGSGAGDVVIENNGWLGGSLDFSGLTGDLDATISSGGKWFVSGSTGVAAHLGEGASDLEVMAGGLMITAHQNSTGATRLDFAGGGDSFGNAGTIVVGPRALGSLSDRDRNEAELRLENLEVFTNSGLILLGGFGLAPGGEVMAPGTDLVLDDILSMPGTRYIGDGGEIVLDVNLNDAGGQASCSTSLRDADGDLPGGDCVAIVGGSTEGTTYVTINDVFAGDRGAYNPDGIVLVDVSGGVSHAGDFILGENSARYVDANGGVIDKGVFFYALVFDEDASQHKLVGLPGGNAMQAPLMAQAAHSVWRTSTGSWLERQADMRGDLDEGIGGGVWLRVAAESADRDVSGSVASGATTFTFDNTFSQSSYAVTGGFDLLSGSEGDTAFVAGLMASYANSEIEYDASPNTAQFDGWTGGAYASFLSGGLFVDAVVNANKLILKQDIPALDLFPSGTLVDSDLLSVGGQVEAGWRFPLMEGAFVEPLASVSYVRTQFDDILIVPADPGRQGVDLEYDDPVSLRAGVGGRVGLDQDYGGFRAQYSLLGRVWNEFEGETDVTLHNIGEDAFVTDEFTGTFTEVGFGASLYSAGGAVSGFLNVGGKFGDDYQATTASAGVRVHW